MSIYYNNVKKLTPLNLYIAIGRLDVCREVCALCNLSKYWNETCGIFSKIFFIIKAALLIIPIVFILIISLVNSIAALCKQVKGVITGTYEGRGFPFTPNEVQRKVYFMNSHIYTGSSQSNLSVEDICPIKEVYATRIKEDLFKVSRNKISRSVKMIRKSLIKNDYVLKGMILDTKFPKMKTEELLNIVRGEASMDAYLIQKIDFGELNKPIKELFSELVIKKHKGLNGSYLILKDNDINKLENSLRRVFMNNKIKIKLKEKEEVSNG